MALGLAAVCFARILVPLRSGGRLGGLHFPLLVIPVTALVRSHRSRAKMEMKEKKG